MKVKTLIIAGTILLFVSACTDPKGTENILLSSGYSNIKINGYSIWGCAEEDMFKTKFTATSSNGNVVNGVVCKGLLKGSTIRFR